MCISAKTQRTPTEQFTNACAPTHNIHISIAFTTPPHTPKARTLAARLLGFPPLYFFALVKIAAAHRDVYAGTLKVRRGRGLCAARGVEAVVAIVRRHVQEQPVLRLNLEDTKQ